MMRFPFIREALTSLFKRPSTERFPMVIKEAPEDYRGKIAYFPEKCINCGMCIRVCAPAAITKTVEKVEKGEKITYEFYMGSCTFCQMCADFCPRNAIELTREYIMLGQDKEDFMVRGTFIKKAPQKTPIQAKVTNESKAE